MKQLITQVILNPLIILMSINGLMLAGQITVAIQVQISKALDKLLE